MTLIPKEILNKMEKCHKHQAKSDDIIFEILAWFEKKGYSNIDGDFHATLNDIQATGVEEYNLNALEQYLKHEK